MKKDKYSIHALTRIDFVLIFGHGMQYFDDILRHVRENKNFKILMIHKHKPKNIKEFIQQIYSHDYAPFWHLKAKTKYLLKTPREVCFIFLQSSVGDEDYFGKQPFRHKESLTLKKMKENIRDKYNPYIKGVRSHNHVIHASDSEQQTHHILKYLGFKEGVNLFCKPPSVIDAPYCIKKFKTIYKIRMINIENLYCNIVDGDSWDDCYIKRVSIKQTPHYLGIKKDIKIYENYINKFIGGCLKDDSSTAKYQLLSKNFNYLKKPHHLSFIIVKKIYDAKYLVLDGLHRASNLLLQNKKNIVVCQILKN